MALPASGQISFNDIRVELGVPSQAPFSLADAAAGSYATINDCSAVIPDSVAPHSVDEWHSYNHTATCIRCWDVTTAASPPGTIHWTDFNGTPRSDAGAATSTTYLLCTQGTPSETPLADVNFTNCLSNCTKVHTNLAGATSDPCAC